MNSRNWHTGSGYSISFEDILAQINDYVSSGGKIFIGTDSQIKSDVVIFASAICLHGSVEDKKYATYFFCKSRLDRKKYTALQYRIMQEVQHSVDLALQLIEKYPEADIEVHVDVGKTKKSVTRKYADTINGWLKGFGFNCKMKPDSWASSSIADHHTK
tara:strand:- start:489 stop:965 length:477 start_codon:yes stop_codon:yes gene_type:complete